MRRLVRILVGSLLVLLLAAIVTTWFGYRATRQVPEFYAAAMSHVRELPPQAGDQLEKRLLALRNDARQTGDWRMVLTDEQLNGWMTRELPVKFPRALPPELREPIVAIRRQGVLFGCRYKDARVDTVLWLEFEPFLTDDPRVVAGQLRKARAGSLPIPTKQLVDELTRAARQADLPLRWDQSGGDPVALFRLPDKLRELNGRRVRVEKIELRDGEIEIIGRSE